MRKIPHHSTYAKPLDSLGDLQIIRSLAIVMAPAGPHSPAGRWLMTRCGVSPASADLYAELAGFLAAEQAHD